MNKSDCKFILIILAISFFGLFMFNILNKQGKVAKVYYEDKLLLSIDLKINKEYIVNGYNGEVKIEVKDGKIKVIEENSPYHICSKQGYISSSLESIICLPNKIVIKVEDDTKLDGVVG